MITFDPDVFDLRMTWAPLSNGQVGVFIESETMNSLRVCEALEQFAGVMRKRMIEHPEYINKTYERKENTRKKNRIKHG